MFLAYKVHKESKGLAFKARRVQGVREFRVSKGLVSKGQLALVAKELRAMGERVRGAVMQAGPGSPGSEGPGKCSRADALGVAWSERGSGSEALALLGECTADGAEVESLACELPGGKKKTDALAVTVREPGSDGQCGATTSLGERTLCLGEVAPAGSLVGEGGGERTARALTVRVGGL